MRSFRPLRLESLESRHMLHGMHPHVTDSEPTVETAADVTTAPLTYTAHAMAAATVDDAYDSNDTFGAAANLGTLSAPKTINGLVMGDAADWYKFKMNATGTSSDYVKLSFLHAKGDLDLELSNSTGRVLGRSQSVTNTERLSLQNLPAGTYYVRAYGYKGVRNPNYSLVIDAAAPVTPPATPPAQASRGNISRGV